MSTEQKKEHGSFLLQGAVLAGAGILTKIIGLAYRIPLTNILGDEGQGLYSVAFQIYSIALLLTSYSLPLGVSKLVSARRAKKAERNAWMVFQTALLFALVVGTGATLILFFGADGIATYVMNQPLSAYALRMLAPCLLVVALMGVLRGYFQGLGSMYPTAISQLLEQILNAVVSVVAAGYLFQVGKNLEKQNTDLSGAYGAMGGTLGTLSGAVAGLFFLLFVLFSLRKRIRRRNRRDSSLVRESRRTLMPILFFTLTPVILSTVVYNISQMLDTILFNHIMAAQGMTAKECSALIGIFDAKYHTILNVPLAMANALGTSVIPGLTAMVAVKNLQAVRHKIYLATRFAMLIAIPSFFGLFALAKPIMELLFSGDIDTAACMMQIGSVSVVFFCLSTVTNALLQGLDKMSIPVKHAAISLGVHLVCLFIMLVFFQWGIYSVVVGNVIFSLLMCILNARAIARETGYEQETKKTFLIPTIAGAIMGMVAFCIYFLLSSLGIGKFSTLVAIFLGILVYLGALLLLGGLTEEELLLFPKGVQLVAGLKKLHLLSESTHYE